MSAAVAGNNPNPATSYTTTTDSTSPGLTACPGADMIAFAECATP